MSFRENYVIRLKFCTQGFLRSLDTNTTSVMTPAVPGGQGDDYLRHPQEFSITFKSSQSKFWNRGFSRSLNPNVTSVIGPTVPGGQGDGYLRHFQEFL